MTGDRPQLGAAAAPPWCRAWLAVLAAATVWGWGCERAAGQQLAAEAAPADTRPATEPFVILPAPQTRPALRPIEKAETVEEALAYSQAERTILAAVRDRDGQLDTQALYVLLRRAEMLPAGPQSVQEADRPNMKNFWKEPAGYRGKLVLVEGGFVKAQDWSGRAAATRWWGTRGAWRVELQELATGEGRPLIVMLTRRPPAVLRQGRRLRFAGLFYKLVTLPQAKQAGAPPQTDEYPVIVASSIYAGPGGAAAAVPPQAYVLFGLIIVLAVAFVFLFRLAARRREAPAGRYRPLRFEEAAERLAAEGQAEAQDVAEGVDEELIRQVQAFKDEKKGPGKAEDAGDQKDTR